MLFNSFDFAIFLPVMLIIYWFCLKKNLKAQNFLLLGGSYVFYGWWDWRFLSLIILSSGLDFFIGFKLDKAENPFKRKQYLVLSIIVNLGLLGFFKYYNFFIDSFSSVFSFFGTAIQPGRLNIILPVGISFYTFQTLSYTVDVYRKKIRHTHDIVGFFVFVGFFPQLVAGPIERASNLLPQFQRKRTINLSGFRDGIRQIIWGLFKKVIIADQSARYVNDIFNNYTEMSGSSILLGAFLFSFQIYADFSGYSDIAIGTARLFGFSLMRNFAYPYFSRDIAEFWRRWHISLTSWFRDYVYMPLGGSRGKSFEKLRNISIIFLLSGFWHGANWTFIIWGGVNALLFLPLILFKRNRVHLNQVGDGRKLPSLIEMFQMLKTFVLVSIMWIFFRAENFGHAASLFKRMASVSLFSIPREFSIGLGVTLAAFIAVEWFQRMKPHPLDYQTRTLTGFFLDSLFISLLIWAIFVWPPTGTQEFIYFQF